MSIILATSIALQFSAAFLSLRLIKITGRWKAWTFIAIALILMGIRRTVTFYRLIIGDVSLPPDITAELIALSISALMLIGVILIEPIFKSIQATNKSLLYKQFSMDHIKDAIFWINSEAKFIDVNDAACNTLNYTKDELLNMQITDINPVFNMDNWDKLWHEWNENDDTTFESKQLTKDGRIFPVEIKITPFIYDGLQSLCATVSDISYRKKSEHQLTFQATHDELTHLINRKEFERRAEYLLTKTRQDKSEHALCYMDLDQFKVVNDTCGHAAGDELLRQISSKIKEVVRRRDTLARLGGDEFAVLMEYCSINDAHRVAMNLQKSIRDHKFSWDGHSFNIGISMGLIQVTKNTSNLSDLFKHADIACYLAKEKGRNRIHIYQPDDKEITRRHGEMQWVTHINRAIEENRFCIYAQSISSLDNNNDVHYELLVRMIDDNGEIILPGNFMPAAERFNLMLQIDRWVIKYIFDLLIENPDFLKHINFISINLSGQSIIDEVFMYFVMTQLDNTGINGEKICFEITETAVISNMDEAVKFITTLKSYGCKFALDDFGSGLSSFGYLKNLPVNYLKIDGMFVKDMVDDPIDHVMVKSINEIGQVMGTKTIAEFVENEEIKNMLIDMGVDYAQGYGIEKPQNIKLLLDKIKINPNKTSGKISNCKATQVQFN